jgi:syntaxin-binding protein 1
LTPDKFVEGIGKLDKKLPDPKSVVPVYTGSIHKSSTDSNTKIPPPRTASSLSNNPKGSHKILGKW